MRPWAPRRIEGPIGETTRLTSRRRENLVPEKLRRRRHAAERRVSSVTEVVEDKSHDRKAYIASLTERASSISSLSNVKVAESMEDVDFSSDRLRSMVSSSLRWSGVGNLQFTPGGIYDSDARRLSDRASLELSGLQARRQTFQENWDKAEIKGDDFLAAVRGLIGDEDGTYAVIGPSADFTGVKRGENPGAGEIGVAMVIRKKKNSWSVYDGSILTTAVKTDAGWSITTRQLADKPQDPFFSISAPLDKAIIANLGLIKLTEEKGESAPIVVKAIVKAGSTVTLGEVAQAITGDNKNPDLPRGSLFVMAESTDQQQGFNVNRNVICAMPEELGQEWLTDFANYSAIRENFAVSAGSTYIAAGTFDTDLAYSRAGHVHGISAESGGHLNSITAGDADVEIAFVVYPSRKSSYTATIPLSR